MRSFHESQAWLTRAEQSIPLGTQTFSKSRLALPQGVAPLFLKKGLGCQVWDLDGNQYTDFISSLLCISLGYADPEVNQAVVEQLAEGSILSLPHPLEAEVAEELVRLIPCADQVRFGKNGTDATSAAIRLARAHTGRERVAVCGYHGWQDWYIGATSRDLGVPKAVKALTHPFTYNDLDSLKALLDAHPGEFAAVILEPMNVQYPKAGFLEGVAELSRRHGALLVFDETITGFRFHLGGAQALFGVTPDLATFGKGMANGFPLSAIVGKAEVMARMHDIFFSGTFGGETLSLAAAKATIGKLERLDGPARLASLGQRLLDGLEGLIAEHRLEGLVSTSGHPSWSFLHLTPKRYSVLELKSLLLQELIERGFLTLGTHNLNLCHTEADIDALLAAYAEVLPLLAEVEAKGTLERHFRGQFLEPVFKVR
ncbi:aminotransferase class III-fold pyridoxal phosphate-dependent enzyme [Gallaecimonas kandeliae]|uniref:aminotransferase class III-fold pyridoxal phosphate-dependent enzyme n=1 Tax=Gallaecimonas kandeliae TaxID=3029055 RepID=UPI00264852F7|nr:aminotransferase class III-fold pyridoxal phosphate-dependent enzyme [Gallaecimonas kandeliae]WKE66731.1 aminotransferase class III-fold pyridoxal phosphate-dependent enzyme [Gallaecimonas kandeliae]